MLIPCADTSISRSRVARVRIQSLPPSFQLARFIKNISNPLISWHEDNELGKWEGVQRHPLNYLCQWQILWSGRKLQGTFPDWSCLPETVTTLHLGMRTTIGLTHYNYLTGSVNFGALHHKLEYLSLSGNSFYGTFDAEHLPSSLRCLELEDNNFEGILCLTALPRNMYKITLQGNQFSGKVSFEALPKTLHRLTISTGMDIQGSIPSCVDFA